MFLPRNRKRLGRCLNERYRAKPLVSLLTVNQELDNRFLEIIYHQLPRMFFNEWMKRKKKKVVASLAVSS
ncbi:hypothetical protein OUZ56_020890 [Daphnia magna]|uniref:Uncharacterized protein n=1 Tax=Daphnia magna TaxID=35525 RepID=A0ABQ9ZFS8_9CRUS|nr:hypothetical protein OUZ56_020890 [Daphnia magna]